MIGMENMKVEDVIKFNPPVSMKSMRKKDPLPERHYILQLTIHDAEDIDTPSKCPGVIRRNYQVLSWINPEDQYLTDEVKGHWKLRWEEQFDIPLKNIVISEPMFLSLEVIRRSSDCDPGPSKGAVVVGRVKGPLPKKLGINQCKTFGLVKFVEGVTIGEGHITVTMKLVRNAAEIL